MPSRALSDRAARARHTPDAQRTPGQRAAAIRRWGAGKGWRGRGRGCTSRGVRRGGAPLARPRARRRDRRTRAAAPQRRCYFPRFDSRTPLARARARQWPGRRRAVHAGRLQRRRQPRRLRPGRRRRGRGMASGRIARRRPRRAATGATTAVVALLLSMLLLLFCAPGASAQASDTDPSDAASKHQQRHKSA